MKTREKIVICVLVAILVVVIIVGVRGNKKTNTPATTSTTGEETIQGSTQEDAVTEEYTKIVNGNVKLNTSNKLSETKTIDGLEVSNIQLAKKDGKTQLLADVKNNTSETKGNYAISIKLIDKDGNEITTMHGYIGTIEAGKTTQLNCSKTVDCANAYDFEISKE